MAKRKKAGAKAPANSRVRKSKGGAALELVKTHKVTFLRPKQ
jgi:hypothetical protein